MNLVEFIPAWLVN